jgi:hypothetical protein
MRMESSVVVNRPIDEVWAYMSNLFNLPRRAARGGGGGRFLGVRQTSPGPVAVGSTFQGRLVVLGFERRFEGTCTEWDPPHAAAIALSVVGMGLRSFSLRLVLEATTDGTRVTRVSEFEPRPTLKPLWMIFLLYLRRSSKPRNQEIKRLIEAEHPSGS